MLKGIEIMIDNYDTIRNDKKKEKKRKELKLKNSNKNG